MGPFEEKPTKHCMSSFTVTAFTHTHCFSSFDLPVDQAVECTPGQGEPCLALEEVDCPLQREARTYQPSPGTTASARNPCGGDIYASTSDPDICPNPYFLSVGVNIVSDCVTDRCGLDATCLYLVAVQPNSYIT